MNDPFVGILELYSGILRTLKSGSYVYNSTKGSAERAIADL